MSAFHLVGNLLHPQALTALLRYGKLKVKMEASGHSVDSEFLIMNGDGLFSGSIETTVPLLSINNLLELNQ